MKNTKKWLYASVVATLFVAVLWSASVSAFASSNDGVTLSQRGNINVLEISGEHIFTPRIILANGRINNQAPVSSMIADAQGHGNLVAAFSGTFFAAYGGNPDTFGQLFQEGVIPPHNDLRWGYNAFLVYTHDGRWHVTDRNEAIELMNREEVVMYVGNMPRLVRNGVRSIEDDGNTPASWMAASAMRTIVGVTADNTLIVLTGTMTFTTAADTLISMGAVSGMAMDGGASAFMYANGRTVTNAGRNLNNIIAVYGVANPNPNASDWAQEYVTTAVERGIVPTTLQERYTQGITRAEFSALAVALYETATGSVITERALFNDTIDLNVQKMGGLGVVTGVGDGNFNPNGRITREQAAIIIVRLANAAGSPLPPSVSNFGDNGMIESWARDAAGQVQASGVMTGSGGNFNPKGTFTIEQSIITMLRLYDFLGGSAGLSTADVGQGTQTPPVPTPQPTTPAPTTPLGEIPAYVTIGGQEYSTALTWLSFGPTWDGGPRLDDDNIQNLRYMVNLTRLSIVGQSISDITPLAGLVNLTNLDLSMTSVIDLTPLAGLVNLTSLDLWSVPGISDLTPLAGLANLTELTLEGAQITDWSPVDHVERVHGRP